MILYKYLRNILIPIHHPVNLHIFFPDLIQHNIISTNHIFIIRAKADPLSKISSHIGKLLYILNSSIYLLNGLTAISSLSSAIYSLMFFKSSATIGLIRNFIIDYTPTDFFSSSKLIQALSSLTASSASCSFINSFFSAFSRS